jgi:hypothetical protein
MAALFQVAEMTIVLSTAGNHYMLRNSRNFYQQYRTDTWSQNVKLTVKSDTAGTQAVVYYKLRDKFQFLVSAGLTLEDIKFEAADSVMTPSIDTFSCLSSTTQCCTVGGSGTTLTGGSCTGFVR